MKSPESANKEILLIDHKRKSQWKDAHHQKSLPVLRQNPLRLYCPRQRLSKVGLEASIAAVLDSLQGRLSLALPGEGFY